MQINEVSPSQINPVETKNVKIDFKDVEEYILTKFISINPSYYELYKNSRVKNSSVFLKSFLDNYKSLLVTNNASEAEAINIINKIFKTIDVQLDILNDMSIKEANNIDAVIIAAAILLSYFSKNLVD